MRLNTTLSRTGCGRHITTAVLVAALSSAAPAAAQDHPILDAAGFQQNRDYFSQAPFENIDTLSGGLVLTFTGQSPVSSGDSTARNARC